MRKNRHEEGKERNTKAVIYLLRVVYIFCWTNRSEDLLLVYVTCDALWLAIGLLPGPKLFKHENCFFSKTFCNAPLHARVVRCSLTNYICFGRQVLYSEFQINLVVIPTAIVSIDK